MISNFIKKIYTKLNLKSLHLFSSRSYAKDYLSTAESFINLKNITSSSMYLIWVDTSNFKTNIFKKSKNSWTLYKSFLCTIGKPWQPTIKGTFFVGAKGYSFGESRGFRCLYYTQIKGNYLFHSIIYYLDGTIKDDRLGMQLTDGCVRLSTENAKWIYDNIPEGTTIFIN